MSYFPGEWTTWPTVGPGIGPGIEPSFTLPALPPNPIPSQPSTTKVIHVSVEAHELADLYAAKAQLEARVEGLLEANNQLVERRREEARRAEALEDHAEFLRAHIRYLEGQIDDVVDYFSSFTD